MKTYRAPQAFLQALEARLSTKPNDSTPLAQRRLLLAVQRLLVRVATVEPEYVLKGGLGLRLRDPRARATKDLDLRLTGERERDESVLRAAASLDLGDFFTFTVLHKEQLAAVPGNSFRCVCTIAGRLFAEFKVDCAGPEPLVGEVSVIPGSESLAFAEIATPRFRVYPLPTQLAEKLHALTLPRTRPNTRDRDLPDIAIVARLSDGIDAALVAAAISSTFAHRRTHEVPRRLEPLPSEWSQRYPRMAQEHSLEWKTFESVDAAVRAFVEPLLAGSARGKWSRAAWRWA